MIEVIFDGTIRSFIIQTVYIFVHCVADLFYVFVFVIELISVECALCGDELNWWPQIFPMFFLEVKSLRQVMQVRLEGTSVRRLIIGGELHFVLDHNSAANVISLEIYLLGKFVVTEPWLIVFEAIAKFLLKVVLSGFFDRHTIQGETYVTCFMRGC